jgi:hypothetical protein
LQDLSLPRRFLKVYRNFGLAIALKVTYSKVRGLLYPAMALPAGRVYDERPRQASFLIDTGEHDAATLDALVKTLEGSGAEGWEICIGERAPTEPGTARLLESLRGTHPRIRIVRVDATVDGTTASRWIVEQATGEFIALVAPGRAPDSKTIKSLLDRLHRDPEIDAAALIRMRSGTSESSLPATDCHLAIQRKTGYLANQPEAFPLTAPALVRRLREAKAPTAYIDAG